MILRHERLSIEEARNFGGKVAGLVFLHSIQVPVPDFFVVTSALDSPQVQEALIDSSLLDDGMKYAVRSSAAGEDSAANSYAGVFESYLNVAPKNIANSIQQVRNSAISERAKKYSESREGSIGQMSVIVQQMVDAKHAGVAFSVHPVTGDNRIAVIEVVPGLGDKLVSGKASPTSVRINKITGMQRVIQHGEQKIEDIELEQIVERVYSYLNDIAEHYENGVDIEWAIGENGKLFVLQARPITTTGGE